MKAIISIVTLLSIILISGSVFARPNRVAQVPNGSRFSCDICHTPAGGLNDFGFDSYDATNNGNVVWAELADLDSDRDGYTNGMELGDPNGSWRTGNSNPGGAITDPSNKTDNGCGNGTLDAGEECDGSILGSGDTCNSLGLGEGTLRCTDSCTYDVGSCGSCGDNIAQPAEECDGTDMADATCEALGYSGGTVSCNSSCGVDISACDGAPSGHSVCGDSIITGGEVCDSIDLGGNTCQSLGFDGGTLGCSNSCGFDTSGCTGGFADRATPDTPADSLGNDGAQAQALAGTDGPDNQFEMTGHACSVAGVSNQATSAPIIIMGFMMLGFGIRRRA